MLFKNVHEYFKKCIWISCLYVYKCTAYIPNAQRGQKRVLNPSELNPGPLQLFLTTGPFLQPCCLCFFLIPRDFIYLFCVYLCAYLWGGRGDWESTCTCMGVCMPWHIPEVRTSGALPCLPPCLREVSVHLACARLTGLWAPGFLHLHIPSCCRIDVWDSDVFYCIPLHRPGDSNSGRHLTWQRIIFSLIHFSG